MTHTEQFVVDSSNENIAGSAHAALYSTFTDSVHQSNMLHAVLACDSLDQYNKY